MKYYYEVLYYNCTPEEFKEGKFDDFDSLGFRTKVEAMKFYNHHKKDEDKAGWWITKRDSESWEVIEDIVW